MAYNELLLLICLTAATVCVDGGRYRHLGCWADTKPLSPDIDDSTTDMGTGSITVDKCAAHCANIGYPYAGIQMNSVCHCGNSYGSQGPSADCNSTCGFYSCGGYLANDVYYAVDSELSTQRQLAVQSASRTFTKARMMCIQNGGDLATPETLDKIIDIISHMATNNTKVSQVWVGLRRRLAGQGNYEWTDENLNPTYEQSKQKMTSLWNSASEPSLDCVSVVLDSKQLTTHSCDIDLPYACQQLPGAPEDAVDESTEAPSSQMSAQSKQLALYVVLPLFLCCYGGSCIIYCIHKIIRNCAKAKRAPPADLSLVTLEQVKHAPPATVMAAAGPMAMPLEVGPGGNNGFGAREKQQPRMMTTGFDVNAKRPLSSGKRSAIVFPAKPFPMYIAQPAPERTVTPVKELRCQSDDPAPQPMAPPPYDREEARRARLLDNAAREARERRQNSRPGTAISSGAATDTSPPHRDPPVPQPKEPDTAKLLQSPRAEGTTTPQGLAGMSINDILKMKMAQKADGRRKPRKIITS